MPGDAPRSSAEQTPAQQSAAASAGLFRESCLCKQPFVHWVVYNIPASAPGLPMAMPSDPSPGLPGLAGVTNGLSGVGRPGYFGPRPPFDGLAHEYHFRLYALDADLDLPEGLNKVELMEAIEGHILATGVLMGYFQRTQ
jgi:Raf kinase inhibitor-like YbhB/YbcL family protein